MSGFFGFLPTTAGVQTFQRTRTARNPRTPLQDGLFKQKTSYGQMQSPYQTRFDKVRYWCVWPASRGFITLMKVAVSSLPRRTKYVREPEDGYTW